MSYAKENLDSAEVNIIELPVSRWQEYKELRLRALNDEPQAFGSSLKKEAERPNSRWKKNLQSVQEGKEWLVFAEMNNHLVGMLGAFPAKSGNGIKVKGYGLFVAREARRKRVAKKMVAKLYEKLISDGVEIIELMVNEDQFAAVALYEKLGFRVAGKDNTVLGDGKEHTELIMEKPIKD